MYSTNKIIKTKQISCFKKNLRSKEMNKLGFAVIHIYISGYWDICPHSSGYITYKFTGFKKKKRQIVQGVPSDNKRPFPKEED